MKIVFPHVPFASLKYIASELEKYGAKFRWVTKYSGTVTHISGDANFYHDEKDSLTISIDLDNGHFGDGHLLKGGMRQFIEDCVEDWTKTQQFV